MSAFPVRSPVTLPVIVPLAPRLRIPVTSLLASNTIALFAAAVPSVISSNFSKSVSLIAALPIVRLVTHVIVPVTARLPRLSSVILSTNPVPLLTV